jgi:hypothetical protein
MISALATAPTLASALVPESPLALGEQVMALLEEGPAVSTYKPALLVALLDAAHLADAGQRLAVEVLAERVLELYWPQTLPCPETERLLLQNQQGGQATIVEDLRRLRDLTGLGSHKLPVAARRHELWPTVLDRTERTLAQWPIPRLHVPFDRFLFDFDWPGDKRTWRVDRYRSSSQSIQLHPGVADGLVALRPLLRPFVLRWWSDKAAQLNGDLASVRSRADFDAHLFGRDRIRLDRVAEMLLDLQLGDCLYCGRRLGSERQVDHFVPWSMSGDDGLDNLVVACARCNNAKRALLAGPRHLASLLKRNAERDRDLDAIAEERSWPRDTDWSAGHRRVAYLRTPELRMLWSWSATARAPVLESALSHQRDVRALLA